MKTKESTWALLTRQQDGSARVDLFYPGMFDYLSAFGLPGTRARMHRIACSSTCSVKTDSQEMHLPTFIKNWLYSREHASILSCSESCQGDVMLSRLRCP